MVETTEAASSGEGSDVHEEMAADVKEFLSQGIWLSDALIKRLEAVAFTEMDEIIEVCQGATDQGSRVLLGNVVDLLGPEWCQEHVKDIVRLLCFVKFVEHPDQQEYKKKLLESLEDDPDEVDDEGSGDEPRDRLAHLYKETSSRRSHGKVTKFYNLKHRPMQNEFILELEQRIQYYEAGENAAARARKTQEQGIVDRSSNSSPARASDMRHSRMGGSQPVNDLTPPSPYLTPYGSPTDGQSMRSARTSLTDDGQATQQANGNGSITSRGYSSTGPSSSVHQGLMQARMPARLPAVSEGSGCSRSTKRSARCRSP